MNTGFVAGKGTLAMRGGGTLLDKRAIPEIPGIMGKMSLPGRGLLFKKALEPLAKVRSWQFSERNLPRHVVTWHRTASKSKSSDVATALCTGLGGTFARGATNSKANGKKPDGVTVNGFFAIGLISYFEL